MKILLAVLMLGATSILADVPEYIQECMDCHGPNGVSQDSDLPTIAGASPFFIEATFAAYEYDLRKKVDSNYRHGDTSRPATNMVEVAKKLSEAQIEAAAKYFSEQTFVAAKQDFDAELAKKGAAIHAEKCEQCHLNGGSSPRDDAPILAGQWTPYLEKAMQAILKDNRDIDERMARLVKRLSKEEWQALLNYYASQQN